MKIEIPDELVDRLVTSTDARRELNAAYERTTISGAAAAGASFREVTASMSSRGNDRLAIGERLSRAVQGQTAALQGLLAAVYTARTGRAPEVA